MTTSNSRYIALLLLEGDTEEEFYRKVAQEKFPRQRKAFKNIKGNYNINGKIVSAAIQYSRSNPDDQFDVYVCIDQERLGYPAYNHKLVHSELCKLHNFGKLLPVIAVLMIESLFFIDIEGIYRHLRTKKSLRNSEKYSLFRKLKHQDISKLFKQSNCVYIKGTRCENLVNSLDINKIVSKAKELSSMIHNIRNRS
jgi:hypothetical protein